MQLSDIIEEINILPPSSSMISRMFIEIEVVLASHSEKFLLNKMVMLHSADLLRICHHVIEARLKIGWPEFKTSCVIFDLEDKLKIALGIKKPFKKVKQIPLVDIE